MSRMIPRGFRVLSYMAKRNKLHMKGSYSFFQLSFLLFFFIENCQSLVNPKPPSPRDPGSQSEWRS